MVAEVLAKVVRDKDLSQEITRDYLGDFNEIKSSINMILSSLSDVMNSFNDVAREVSRDAESMAHNSSSVAEGAGKQAATIEELSASMDIINERTDKTSKSAEEVNELSQTSRSNVVKGDSEVQKMLEAIADIKKANENISQINSVIESIATQTNLLALNASIEAARAGEHGKGFTIVADEVRNLAARSREASKEAAALIQESSSKGEIGESLAQLTAESLQTIVSDFSKISEVISDIARDSKEQAESIKQVLDGVNEISSVVAENALSATESAAVSSDLFAQADTFKQMVAAFTTKK